MGSEQRVEPDLLRVVQPAEWADIEVAMLSAPVNRKVWNPADCIALPDGAEIVVSVNQGRNERYILTTHRRLCIQIQLSGGQQWLATFLKGIRTACEGRRTIADWIDELQIDPKKFLETLDVLHDCGFEMRVDDSNGSQTVRHSAVGDLLDSPVVTPAITIHDFSRNAAARLTANRQESSQ